MFGGGWNFYKPIKVGQKSTFSNQCNKIVDLKFWLLIQNNEKVIDFEVWLQPISKLLYPVKWACLEMVEIFTAQSKLAKIAYFCIVHLLAFTIIFFYHQKSSSI